MLNTLDSHNDLTAPAAPHAWSLEGLALDEQAVWETEQREAEQRDEDARLEALGARLDSFATREEWLAS